jgi:4-hydroxy-4-methyl-2-oxoglutarate aldolase
MLQVAPSLETLLESFRGLSTASVSDAADRVVGERRYMFHNIKPIFECKLVGPAATVLTAPSSEPAPPRLALELIDSVPGGTVLVIGVGGEREEVAAWGGIMTAGAQVHGIAGTVTDGAARDVKEVTELGYPVFAGAVVPATSVGRFVNVASQVPITCGGVKVEPGDIIVGDPDGVVVVPRQRAEEILTLAMQLEADEARMSQEIRAEGSILKAMAKLGRI